MRDPIWFQKEGDLIDAKKALANSINLMNLQKLNMIFCGLTEEDIRAIEESEYLNSLQTFLH